MYVFVHACICMYAHMYARTQIFKKKKQSGRIMVDNKLR